jgi:branched-chain amino acid transport system substrate-binding protein
VPRRAWQGPPEIRHREPAAAARVDHASPRPHGRPSRALRGAAPSSTIPGNDGSRGDKRDETVDRYFNQEEDFHMKKRLCHLAASAAFALALAASPALAQKKYDAGASDTEIKIGQTVPFSGPYSVYANIGKTQAAYMKMINDQGGINGRKINLIQYDDAYSPPKTVEQVRKLVESDEVLFTFQLIGTAANAAVQKYLNGKKVPQLFAATGASRFSDPKEYPWTMGYNPNYFVEGRIYGQYILKEHPNAKIGVLYQNDDLGKDYLNGIKAGLGDKAAKMIVTEASYEVSDPTVDSQVLKIKDAGADLFFSASTPKQAAQAIKKIAEMGWHPVQIVDINATSVGAVLKPAGLDAAKGLISVNYGKEPLDPTWKDDAGLKKYFDFMAKYYPDGDKDSNFNTYGYSTAQLLVHVLKQCGDDLTRENVMKQAASVKDFATDTALPGIKVNTSPTDYRVNKQLQMMKFNGERWELFGPILEDAGPAG